MSPDLQRRKFLGVAGAAVAAGVASNVSALGAPAPSAVKILGIACSPRKGKTTAASVAAALKEATGVSTRVEVELIVLDPGSTDGSATSRAGSTPVPTGRGTRSSRSTAARRS